MDIVPTCLKDVKIIKLKQFSDDRGFFLESFHQKKWEELIGQKIQFVQDNHSRSFKNVLRGLHYQVTNPQGKLVRVMRGSIYDVVVDLRKDSETFGKWIHVHLAEDIPELLWIPPGFAHGFLVLSDLADVVYKVTTFYDPPSDRTLMWNDPTIAISWPLRGDPILSPKDAKGLFLEQTMASHV